MSSRLDFRRLSRPVFDPPRRETAARLTRWPCLWRNWKIDYLRVSDVTGSETGFQFFCLLAQNCIKHSRTHPNDFRNSFSVHFCTLWHAVNFLWSSNGWKKRSKRRCSEKIKWKSLWFTTQNFQRIEYVPLSNINVGGYICNESSYRDLKRLEKILEDAKSLQQQSLKEEFTTNNRTKRCVPSDSRISPSVSAPSKSLRHAMDQGRTFCFDLIISATIFARRKSAGGNMIGLNPQRKSHVSSGSFGGMSAGSFFRTAAGNRA